MRPGDGRHDRVESTSQRARCAAPGQPRWLVPERRVCYAPAVADPPSARRVTRDVEPAALRGLLDHPPRATVAFVDGDRAAVLPARARLDGDRHLFAVAADAAPALDRCEVVLMIDDGWYWFQLRGVSVRGIAHRVDPPADAEAAPLAWYGVDTRRVLAWDYGAVRVRPSPSQTGQGIVPGSRGRDDGERLSAVDGASQGRAAAAADQGRGEARGQCAASTT